MCAPRSVQGDVVPLGERPGCVSVLPGVSADAVQRRSSYSKDFKQIIVLKFTQKHKDPRIAINVLKWKSKRACSTG